MTKSHHIVVISTADWDHPLWTNKQHVSCSLAEHGFHVLYVESLALRPLRVSSKDFRRVVRRVLKWLSPPRKVTHRISICSPLVIPNGQHGLPLIFNRLSIRLTISFSQFLLGFKEPWLWTYNPLTARLIDLKRYKRVIYHAVDAIHEQPDMPTSLIVAEERSLCSSSDYVFVTSPQLKKALSPYSCNIRFDPNVADFFHFNRALTFGSQEVPSDLRLIPEPRIGYIGAISSYKLHIPLIASIAQSHPELSFVFIGPTEEGEAKTDLASWRNIPNIYILGSRSYSELPRYCAGFACAWLPLRHNEYTNSMFPMKFFEYLASGLPVVATSIQSLQEFSSVALLCEVTVDSFSYALHTSLSGVGADLDSRISLARQYTYQTRLSKMLAYMQIDCDDINLHENI